MRSDDHLKFEEEFHAKDRKAHRKERKIAEAKDRSKYKKSDQDKLKKQQAPAEETGHRGLVLQIKPEGISVAYEGQVLVCQLKGQLKHEKKQIKNLIAVGDNVRFLPKNEKEGTIIYIEERHSILSRADNLSRKKEQLIAVNIDLVLITCSVVSPRLKPHLIDRYIIAAKKGNLQPVIVFNKVDLLEHGSEGLSKEEFEEEKEIYRELLHTYHNLNIPLFPVSTKTNAGIDALKELMKGKQSVLSGQSGVGKSSLINSLIGSNLPTGEIVEKTSKGSHTTTIAELLPLPTGGFCIDTPGIKSFGIWDLEKKEIEEYFTEIHSHGEHCKYPDCSHTGEPGCAVLTAVEQGKISHLRFASYCALIQEEEHRHR